MIHQISIRILKVLRLGRCTNCLGWIGFILPAKALLIRVCPRVWGFLELNIININESEYFVGIQIPYLVEIIRLVYKILIEKCFTFYTPYSPGVFVKYRESVSFVYFIILVRFSFRDRTSTNRYNLIVAKIQPGLFGVGSSHPSMRLLQIYENIIGYLNVIWLGTMSCARLLIWNCMLSIHVHVFCHGPPNPNTC